VDGEGRRALLGSARSALPTVQKTHRGDVLRPGLLPSVAAPVERILG
jgi:hypothetical protein